MFLIDVDDNRTFYLNGLAAGGISSFKIYDHRTFTIGVGDVHSVSSNRDIRRGGAAAFYRGPNVSNVLSIFICHRKNNLAGRASLHADGSTFDPGCDNLNIGFKRNLSISSTCESVFLGIYQGNGGGNLNVSVLDAGDNAIAIYRGNLDVAAGISYFNRTGGKIL